VNTKTVKLTTPVEIFGKKVTEIQIKEPTGAQYLTFGDPVFLVNSSGGLFQTEDREAVKKYLHACVEHESGEHLLHLLSLADARAVKEALLSFFANTAQETSPS